jgi:hypothetical protein
MQVFSYASMQVCKEGRVCDLPESPVEGSNRSVSMQFEVVQVCNYASLQLCKYASMQVCMEGRVSDLPVSPAENSNRSV